MPIKYYDPKEVLKRLRETTNDHLLELFSEDHYIPYIELLQGQVFERFGCKLVVIQDETKD